MKTTQSKTIKEGYVIYDAISDCFLHNPEEFYWDGEEEMYVFETLEEAEIVKNYLTWRDLKNNQEEIQYDIQSIKITKYITEEIVIESNVI